MTLFRPRGRWDLANPCPSQTINTEKKSGMRSQTKLLGFVSLSDCCSAVWITNEAVSPSLGNTCQTSTCFKVETVDTLKPNSPGATDDKKHTRLASFLFVVSGFLRLSFCVPSLETVSDFVKLGGRHKHCISTRDCRTSREHQGGSELATSGVTFPAPLPD